MSDYIPGCDSHKFQFVVSIQVVIYSLRQITWADVMLMIIMIIIIVISNKR